MVNYVKIENVVLADLRANLNDEKLCYAFAHAINVALMEYEKEQTSDRNNYRKP